MSPGRTYHHGDVRTAVLAAAVEAIGDCGASSMRVRDVARRAGVSHTAATYHFGDRAGLLTAVAVDGYRLLAVALRAAQREHRSFLEVGVAYVRFAVAHPAHFEVMFQPTLYDTHDEELRAAKREAAALLYGSHDATTEEIVAGVAAWSLVHGFATLWSNGNLPERLGEDPTEVARVVAAHLRVRRR